MYQIPYSIEQKIKKTILYKHKINCQKRCSNEILQNLINEMRIESFLNIVSDEVIFNFQSYFYAEHETIIEERKELANWFERFKDKYFNSKLFKYFPLKYKTYPVKVERIIPILEASYTKVDTLKQIKEIIIYETTG